MPQPIEIGRSESCSVAGAVLVSTPMLPCSIPDCIKSKCAAESHPFHRYLAYCPCVICGLVRHDLANCFLLLVLCCSLEYFERVRCFRLVPQRPAVCILCGCSRPRRGTQSSFHRPTSRAQALLYRHVRNRGAHLYVLVLPCAGSASSLLQHTPHIRQGRGSSFAGQ